MFTYTMLLCVLMHSNVECKLALREFSINLNKTYNETITENI
jgi:hypothetical protein